MPGFNVTVVPEPENEFGVGLLPVTEMVKSEGFSVPPLVVVTTKVPTTKVYRLVIVG